LYILLQTYALIHVERGVLTVAEAVSEKSATPDHDTFNQTNDDDDDDDDDNDSVADTLLLYY
jgi:hypothetical protein